MMGVVVGDALGMPVQFIDRMKLKNNPVKTMEGDTEHIICHREHGLMTAVWH